MLPVSAGLGSDGAPLTAAIAPGCSFESRNGFFDVALDMKVGLVGLGRFGDAARFLNGLFESKGDGCRSGDEDIISRLQSLQVSAGAEKGV